MSFADALAFVLKWEGGAAYTNDPMDRGGATKYGITQRTYTGWLLGQNRDPEDVKDLTEATAHTIYRDLYWKPCGAEDLEGADPALALCLFDTAVNMGVRVSVIFLQGLAGTAQDGQFGPETRMAAELAIIKDAPMLHLEYLKKRWARYRLIVQKTPSQLRFLTGWRNRLLDLARTIHLSPADLG